jgi:hypothetical protein
MVGVGGLLVVLVGLAHDENVVPPPEGVGVHLHGVQVRVGVPALSLYTPAIHSTEAESLDPPKLEC